MPGHITAHKSSVTTDLKQDRLSIFKALDGQCCRLLGSRVVLDLIFEASTLLLEAQTWACDGLLKTKCISHKLERVNKSKHQRGNFRPLYFMDWKMMQLHAGEERAKATTFGSPFERHDNAMD
jgi:hypothetical protein